MTKLKLLSSAFAILATVYSLTLHYGNGFGNRVPVCQNIFFQAIQPWDSGCFYSAIFKKENTLADLHFEKYKLDAFMRRGGLSPNVLWYRSMFYRQFQHIFDYTVDDIDQAHWKYMSSIPYKLNSQVAYLQYLMEKRSPEASQQALDLYCKTYVKIGSTKDALATLAWLLKQKKLDLKMEFCNSRSDLVIKPESIFDTFFDSN